MNLLFSLWMHDLLTLSRPLFSHIHRRPYTFNHHYSKARCSYLCLSVCVTCRLMFPLQWEERTSECMSPPFLSAPREVRVAAARPLLGLIHKHTYIPIHPHNAHIQGCKESAKYCHQSSILPVTHIFLPSPTIVMLNSGLPYKSQNEKEQDWTFLSLMSESKFNVVGHYKARIYDGQ